MLSASRRILRQKTGTPKNRQRGRLSKLCDKEREDGDAKAGIRTSWVIPTVLDDNERSGIAVILCEWISLADLFGNVEKADAKAQEAEDNGEVQTHQESKYALKF